ncbi:Sds3-like-domain-containing protein [Dissophora ornata]|nr:Sds3-like-domain-containing protein [Dissophora ornata]
MLEASSLRRKHSSSPTDIKSGATNPFSTSNSSRASPSSLAVKSNDNSTVVEGDVDMQEASPSEMQEDQQSPQPGTPLDGLSAEDLSGVLDGALDDVDDEDLDGDTEDTEVAHEMEGASEGQNVDEEEDGENEDDVTQEDESKHDESGETNGPENEAVEEVASDNVDEEMGTPHSEDQGDGDGDVAINEQESDVEDEVTLATHTEDEDSEHPEEEGSHAEEEDDDDEDGEADEAEDDDDDEQPSPTPEVKKDVSSYPQKPTLNRPQLIEEELKDSGDELSDLSEFDDSDDSDEEEEEEEEEAEGTNKAKAGTNSLASNSSTTTSRPAPGTRKRSLREMSRDLKEQEEKMKRASKDNEGTDNQHSDRETESEVAEEEDVEEEKAEGDDEVEEEEREEEEDLEKKQLHMDALEALTTIEIEFATLRDNMYEERMLELDREVEMINDGTHPELSTLMKEIEDKREQRLKVAKAWRTHMGEIAQCEFEIKEYQAHCTFQSKKREIRNDITQELGRTKRKVILELTLASDSRRKNAIADKLSLVRARRHRRAEVNELRTLKEQYGFPASTKLRMVSTTELDEDFMAMGLPRTAIQLNAVEHEPQYLGRSMGTSSSPRLSTATATQKWSAPSDYSPYPRSEVEIYAEGNRCNVDGI